MKENNSETYISGSGEIYELKKPRCKKAEEQEGSNVFDLAVGFARKGADVLFTYSRKAFNNLFEDQQTDMSRRRDKIEPMGPVYLIKSVRDQIQLFQEKRGITPDENNFVNLMAVVIQQSGQAMYAVFTMFLALLPIITILIHVAHFVLDRVVDVITTRKKQDLWVKGGIFIAQLTVIFIALKFIIGAIFSPIFSMQLTIISKMLFFDDDSGGC
ncbi:uncharacterized protein LOC106668386 [Cimex lectularius]|uniref:Uncharacterized protein n=1 Tax=Cimex lectularius TaxID=79782 RepID=A0A8I6RUH7_CIMLE|nr:uncharacterized protein LOC106668386 [Cimex lectularius]